MYKILRVKCAIHFSLPEGLGGLVAYNHKMGCSSPWYIFFATPNFVFLSLDIFCPPDFLSLPNIFYIQNIFVVYLYYLISYFPLLFFIYFRIFNVFKVKKLEPRQKFLVIITFYVNGHPPSLPPHHNDKKQTP